MRSSSKGRILAVVCSAVSYLLTVAVSPSHAAATGVVIEDRDTATSANAAQQELFVAQGRNAGLTNPERESMDATTGYYVRLMHGRRVAVNKVTFSGGNVEIPLPRAAAQLPQDQCGEDNFCIWHEPRWQGAIVRMYTCEERRIIWGTEGSWLNMQERHPATAVFYDLNHNVWGYAPPSNSQYKANWYYVYHIDPC